MASGPVWPVFGLTYRGTPTTITLPSALTRIGLSVTENPDASENCKDIGEFGSTPLVFISNGVSGRGEVVESEVIAGPVVAVRLNVAVTAWFEFIVTVQVPVPEQAPDHPANVEPVFDVAVNVTTVPAG